MVRIHHPPPERGSDQAGVAQLVERQPSKLNVAGSNPVARSDPRQSFSNAHLAQSVEHVLGKDEVSSSILDVGSLEVSDLSLRV